jgi:hypothetical protein
MVLFRASLDGDEFKFHATGGRHFDQHVKTWVARSATSVFVKEKSFRSDFFSYERNAAFLNGLHERFDESRFAPLQSFGETLSQIIF